MNNGIIMNNTYSGRRANQAAGFTLLEILLVVALISILAGIVIVAINPGKQLAEARNAQRRADVNTLVNAVYQYVIDTGADPGTLPVGTSCAGSANNEICKNTSGCGALVNLANLVSDQKYLAGIPVDPLATGSGAGYYIIKSENGRITVCAPRAELGTTISVTR